MRERGEQKMQRDSLKDYNGWTFFFVLNCRQQLIMIITHLSSMKSILQLIP